MSFHETRDHQTEAMEVLIDCYFDRLFSEMDRSCLASRYKRREMVGYFSDVINSCSQGKSETLYWDDGFDRLGNRDRLENWGPIRGNDFKSRIYRTPNGEGNRIESTVSTHLDEPFPIHQLGLFVHHLLENCIVRPWKWFDRGMPERKWYRCNVIHGRNSCIVLVPPYDFTFLEKLCKPEATRMESFIREKHGLDDSRGE